MFGSGSFERPWQQDADAPGLAKCSAEITFEFFYPLNMPYYCFHGVDVSPEGASAKEYLNNVAKMTEVLAQKNKKPV